LERQCLSLSVCQLDHYNQNEWGYTYRFFSIGFVLNAGLGVMVAFTANLSAMFDRNLQFAMFAVFLQAVPILARIINANFFIQTSHESRLLVVCFLLILSYIVIYLAIYF
jgi:hypothetical protein